MRCACREGYELADDRRKCIGRVRPVLTCTRVQCAIRAARTDVVGVSITVSICTVAPSVNAIPAINSRTIVRRVSTLTSVAKLAMPVVNMTVITVPAHTSAPAEKGRSCGARLVALASTCRYRLLSDGRTCERVQNQGCQLANGGCQHNCHEVGINGDTGEPTVQCTCRPGFRLDPLELRSCHGRDACTLLPDTGPECL
jgi:hypothetical protein